MKIGLMTTDSTTIDRNTGMNQILIKAVGH